MGEIENNRCLNKGWGGGVMWGGVGCEESAKFRLGGPTGARREGFGGWGRHNESQERLIGKDRNAERRKATQPDRKT